MLPHTSMQYEMFRPRPIHRTFCIGRFAPPCLRFRKTFRTPIISQKDVSPSSHTRLASPEVVDRGLAESVFQDRFFLFDPSLTSGMSAALMQGHCLRHRPCNKQHMSDRREFHRKYPKQLPPHLTKHETLHAAGLD